VIIKVPVYANAHCVSTRTSSGDQIANVNFLYDDIVHALQSTIDGWCINSATDRRGYVLEHRFTKFSKITQCNGHCAVQSQFKVTDFGTNRMLIYDILLVINTNLPPILHRFQVMLLLHLASDDVFEL